MGVNREMGEAWGTSATSRCWRLLQGASATPWMTSLSAAMRWFWAISIILSAEGDHADLLAFQAARLPVLDLGEQILDLCLQRGHLGFQRSDTFLCCAHDTMQHLIASLSE
jgi:hypothetical protein